VLNNPVICCNSISKRYRLFTNPRDRLAESLSNFFSRWLPLSQVALGRDYWALHKVSFTVLAGETVAIIGRNGSGKSTLLQIIAGTLTPTEGSVSVYGRVAALLELGAGFDPEFTGLENVQMMARILGLDSEEINRCLPDILAFADIGAYLHQPVKTYSSGMYVRLAFAIAVHVNPDILIVDEAFAVGDLAFQAKCMARIRRFQEEGKTILFVSHDINAVKALCSRSIYLDEGKVLDIGPTTDIVDHFIRDIHMEPIEAKQQKEQIGSPSLRLPDFVSNDYQLLFAEFDRMFQGKRNGSGEARVRYVELQDKAGKRLEQAEFDAEVNVLIWVECIKPCTVSVNYKIRDRYLVSIAGADFLIAGKELLAMTAGNYYLVEYTTRLPLMDGDYSLRISITVPIAKHEQALFVDVVEITNPFKLGVANRGKIYTQVYLHNNVSVKSL
jgi:lipopolysaccharide transport system ATP-binding protein